MEVERSAANLLLDFEQGGEQLGVSPTSNSFVWAAEATGSGVILYRDGVEPVQEIFLSGITEVALGFDGSMRPHIAYVQSNTVYFRYWNSLASAYDTLTLEDARSPRLATNDKRDEFSLDRDLILAYMRGSTPYVRYQRDRFAVEEEIVPDAETASKLTSTSRIAIFGRSPTRLQWRFVP